jgi:hypothetical protein
MSYGMEVLDSNGKTVFNSTDFVELGSHYAIISGGDTVPIPDWCKGGDASYQTGTYSRTNTNSWFYESWETTSLHFPYDTSKTTPSVNDEMTHLGVVYTVTSVNIANVVYDFNTGTFDYSNAVWRVFFDKSTVSFRNTNAVRSFAKVEKYIARPVVYARPLSATYSGSFQIFNGVLKDYASGTNSFEIIIANSAEEWGSIDETRTTHYLSGSAVYGVRGLTANTERYTPNSPVTSFVTYDTRTRPVKVLLAKAWFGGTTFVPTTFSLGSLNTSTTKRWCRMNSTELRKVKGYNEAWTVRYTWSSNNSISLAWGEASNSAVIEYTSYTTNAPYAVVEFGEGI